MVRQEPRQRFFRLNAVVDAELRDVALLVDEGLERQLRRARRQITAVAVEARVCECHVFARPR